VIGPIVESDAKCDFGRGCDEPRWLYPADTFTYLAAHPAARPHVSAGPWLACDRCHALVERGEWKTLATQGIPPTTPPEHWDAVLRWVTDFQLGFAAARTGPARRWSPP
jgi:hypothetical protein